MNVPADLRYTTEHEWIRTEGDAATIGITDYAQDQLGDIVFLDLPAVGANIAALEKMGEIESVKAVSDLFMPVGGEVVEVNQAAADEPEVVNNEPYGAGWLIKVRLSDASELEKLLTADAYDALIVRAMEENTD